MTADPQWQRLAAVLEAHCTRATPFVQLVPELEPQAVAFCTWHPDRLLCGREAFAVLRAQGLIEAPP